MDSLLARHRPKNLSQEKWEEQWEAAGATLQPFADALKDVKRGLGKVKADDFDSPNHYAKLVSELAKAQLIDQLLAMLPSSVDK